MTEDIKKWETRHPAELVPVETPLMVALRQDSPPELIEKMMDLQERNEKYEAKKAYHVAMAAFKESPPEIGKDRTVEYTGTKYTHASLGNVTALINKALSAHGLSAGWKTVQDGDAITVECSITHILGHSESTSLTAAPDKSGSKNAIQAIGSTVSYLQRYTILALTGLATHDMDNDGAGGEPEKEFITPEQAEEISELLKAKNINIEKWFADLKIETVDTVPADWFAPALRDLKKAAVRRESGADG